MVEAKADDQPDYGINPQYLLDKSKYEFRFMGLQDGTTMGIFRFEWKGDDEIRFALRRPPKGSTFTIDVPDKYLFWVNNKWLSAEEHVPLGCFPRPWQLVKSKTTYFMLIDVGQMKLRQDAAKAPAADKMVIVLYGAVGKDNKTGAFISDQIPLPLSEALDQIKASAKK